MDHYRHYTVENFIDDSRFRAWVRRPSASEDLAWQRWVDENPQQRVTVERARAMVLAIHPVHAETISDAEIRQEVTQILDILDEEEQQHVQEERTSRRPVYWLTIAASVTVVFMASWYLFTRLASSDTVHTLYTADNYRIERVNESEEPILITLPDNSSVLLSQNSRIVYPKAFDGNTREVVLEGQAFFEVTKNAKKPFYVNAGHLVAKVLGTSFEIDTQAPGRQVRVIVRTGTVGIYTDSAAPQQDPQQKPNVVLTQNEQLTYGEVDKQLQHTRLEAAAVDALDVPDTYLQFTGTPVAAAFHALEKAYGVTIAYDPQQVAGCSVTARFTDEPFALKLDLICRSIGVRYTLANDRVAIEGHGCRN
ncbi:FecR domain-containing protein [Fulvivirgaceae bacterium PWU5]|uniref:FecR domain-containing protein n=1 Tax=Dawidia cretensis TaxID=2782350 RepID=A0AAP2E2G9_9BACT|nr:FecR family protein [Dawidia cretensis]MBT1711505.1 FecR domain-containing protein [Dawidia cretensis]